MKIAGIIAEYNPFHNGHAYHIMETRKHATHIAAVISGHFTQRGDISCLSKWTRAKVALENGADLVIELPAIYACSSAERFAFGGVSLLNSLGCIDMLSFGSEIGEIAPLEECSKKCLEINQTKKMQELLKQGLPYPKARQTALGEAGKVLATPNNTLGVEYIKAALSLKAEFTRFTVGRVGAVHDGIDTDGDFASASFLRSSENWESFVPKNSIPVYKEAFPKENALFSRLEKPLMYLLRTTEKSQWRQLPDVTEGLENRLFAAAQTALSADEFLNTVKTKRYTMSRLRRILCSLILGIKKEDYSTPPLYARVLASNSRGFEILAKAKDTSSVQISTDFALLNRNYPTQTLIDKKSTDIFYLASPCPTRGCQDYYRKPVIINNIEDDKNVL